ncbi:Response regulator receiver domain-containing protein [Mariprofundus ferrinatatus]|uniref:Response regulator receiver domain-containing protein n=1 Tax=Mariprofundus ferrinatatus TaxID=1921087 RepID=A0A2K8L253_9PROT|nr:response regulator [Mariprofundus ferrinatatus]ATX81367.1 Response regulator receiver domain-containing protein [Mariprofundus ferrinatatus]
MALFHHVEDSKPLCELFSEIMRLFGHEIISFSNGLKYLEYIEDEEAACPVAVFTDIDMPVMDGYEMIEKVIGRYPNRLIVVLSAHAERGNVNEIHVFQHVDKPFQASSLEKLAKVLIAKKLSLGASADLLNV